MTDEHDLPAQRRRLGSLVVWAALGALAAVLIAVVLLSARRPGVPTLTPGPKSAAVAMAGTQI
jgi:hypothetical protein